MSSNSGDTIVELKVEFLTTSSATEQCFYTWAPIFFVLCTHTRTQVMRYTFLLLASHYLTVGDSNLQRSVTVHPQKAGNTTVSKKRWI